MKLTGTESREVLADKMDRKLDEALDLTAKEGYAAANWLWLEFKQLRSHYELACQESRAEMARQDARVGELVEDAAVAGKAFNAPAVVAI